MIFLTHTRDEVFTRLFVIFLYYSIAQKPLQGITILLSFSQLKVGIHSTLFIAPLEPYYKCHTRSIIIVCRVVVPVPEHNYLCFTIVIAIGSTSIIGTYRFTCCLSTAQPHNLKKLHLAALPLELTKSSEP